MRSKSIKFFLAHVLQSGFDLPVGPCECPLRVRSGRAGTVGQQSATDLRCELREVPWSHPTEERAGTRLAGSRAEGRPRRCSGGARKTREEPALPISLVGFRSAHAAEETTHGCPARGRPRMDRGHGNHGEARKKNE